jgi:hypothetical protein
VANPPHDQTKEKSGGEPNPIILCGRKQEDYGGFGVHIESPSLDSDRLIARPGPGLLTCPVLHEVDKLYTTYAIYFQQHHPMIVAEMIQHAH